MYPDQKMTQMRTNPKIALQRMHNIKTRLRISAMKLVSIGLVSEILDT